MQVALDVAHQHQVDQQQVHRRVADPLADAERRPVQARGAGLEGGDAVDHGEVAVAVTVPVDADVRAELASTCATNRTTAAAPPAWRARRCRRCKMRWRRPESRIVIQRAQRLGVGARRVLGDVHHVQALARPRTSIASSVLPQQAVEVQPSVYWRIGDEPMNVHALDRHAGPLRDLDDRRMSATMVRAAQFGRTDSSASTISRASRSTSRDDVRAGAGQADVGRVDAERVDR